MRKIILNLAVSIDGFIEDGQGQFDWCFTDQDYSSGQFERFDTVLMGRKSYDLMLQRDELPIMNLKTYVFSNSLEKVKYGTIINNHRLEAEVKQLKNATGKDIWFFGGANLLTSFLEKNLIDELQLAIHPIMLGEGMKLFAGQIDRRINCELIDVKSFNTGLVMLKYKIEY